MRTILILAAASLLSACGSSPARVQDEVEVAATPAPTPYAFAGKGTALPVGTGTILDEGTGCEYVYQTMYQDDVTITPRLEATATGSRQRCGAPVAGSVRMILRASGNAAAVNAGVLTDGETGCQYITVTMYQDAAKIIPRMGVSGDDRLPVCRKAA